MNARDEQLYEEAAALWRELHGASPPATVDASSLLAILVQSTPIAEYERLHSRHLGERDIVRPARARTAA
ncbi:MAG TPA: hypothetical protein VG939_02550 [Caulobacteraceae bacterium]|nr:hypothetical protein [Caulobacteraceae bacterium]